MDLDKRIKDRKYIFDCFSVDEVKKYIGKVCYLSNDIAKFSDLDNVDFDVLKYIGKGYFFGGDKQFMFCLPLEFVKEKENKYKIFRPYKSISEFCNETGCEEVGADLITIRNKRRKQECVLLYTGYSEDAVHLGGYVLTFDTLLKHYEFYNKCGEDGEWLPFGVEE